MPLKRRRDSRVPSVGTSGDQECPDPTALIDPVEDLITDASSLIPLGVDLKAGVQLWVPAQFFQGIARRGALVFAKLIPGAAAATEASNIAFSAWRLVKVMIFLSIGRVLGQE
jgi:hypothetical protein